MRVVVCRGGDFIYLRFYPGSVLPLDGACVATRGCVCRPWKWRLWLSRLPCLGKWVGDDDVLMLGDSRFTGRDSAWRPLWQTLEARAGLSVHTFALIGEEPALGLHGRRPWDRSLGGRRLPLRSGPRILRFRLTSQLGKPGGGRTAKGVLC